MLCHLVLLLWLLLLLWRVACRVWRVAVAGMIMQCVSTSQGNTSMQQCSGLSNDYLLGFTATCVEQGTQVKTPPAHASTTPHSVRDARLCPSAWHYLTRVCVPRVDVRAYSRVVYARVRVRSVLRAQGCGDGSKLDDAMTCACTPTVYTSCDYVADACLEGDPCVLLYSLLSLYTACRTAVWLAASVLLLVSLLTVLLTRVCVRYFPIV